MVCSKYYCDYNKYYGNQAGGDLGISYYRDNQTQWGSGFFSSLNKRYGVPVLKYLLKQGYYAGKDIFKDLREGKKISAKSVLKKRAASTFKDLGENLEQVGSGLRKKPKLLKNRKKRQIKIKRNSKSKRSRRGSKLRRKKSTNNSKKYNKLNKDIFI